MSSVMQVPSPSCRRSSEQLTLFRENIAWELRQAQLASVRAPTGSDLPQCDLLVCLVQSAVGQPQVLPQLVQLLVGFSPRDAQLRQRVLVPLGGVAFVLQHKDADGQSAHRSTISLNL